MTKRPALLASPPLCCSALRSSIILATLISVAALRSTIASDAMAALRAKPTKAAPSSKPFKAVNLSFNILLLLLKRLNAVSAWLAPNCASLPNCLVALLAALRSAIYCLLSTSSVTLMLSAMAYTLPLPFKCLLTLRFIYSMVGSVMPSGACLLQPLFNLPAYA